MSKTVNQIRTELALLAQAHAMINDFKWKDLVQAMNEDVCQYPLMTAGYVTGDNFANQDQIQLKVSVCDKIYKDWNQINDDVESDTKEICRHIYNAMSSPRWKKIGRIEGFTIQKFVADFQDYTLGHTMTINFRIRKNSGTCDLPIFGYDFDSAVSGNTCEPVTYTIKDSADNVLYSGSVPSGGNINETITDSTAVLKDTDGNVLSTTTILAEGSEDIEAPNSTYEVEYENGTPIESGSIPSGGFKLIQVPNPIVCADAVVNVNSVFFDNVASGGTLNIQVRKSTGNDLVGSKQGQFWRIGDSTAVLKTSGGATISTTSIKAEESEDIIAPDATVTNSNASYTDSVASGDTLVLPDITVTDSDGSTYTQPSVEDVTCTAQIKDLFWELNYNGTDDVIYIPATASNVGTLTSGTGSNVGTITVSTDNVTYGALTFPFTPVNSTTYYFKRSTATVNGTYTMTGTYA
jgi:hypothetical protein